MMAGRESSEKQLQGNQMTTLSSKDGHIQFDASREAKFSRTRARTCLLVLMQTLGSS